MGFGIAGLSVVADSLSAMKHAKVRVVRDDTGLVADDTTEGDFPKFGNNDNRVGHLASRVVSTFMAKLRKYPTCRNAVHPHGLLLDAESFPGWADVAAALAHLKFVREHHRKIQRVAVVSDSRFLTAAPKIATHLVRAEVRPFPRSQREEALGWLRGEGP